ncbi:unnamed protein product [Rhodiola kirilowii]
MAKRKEVDVATSDEEVREEQVGVMKPKEHVKQLQRLQDKDPEFYEFLKEHDKELLEFDDEDDEDEENVDVATDMDEEEHDADGAKYKEKNEDTNLDKLEDKQSRKVITSAMVDSWCEAVKENVKVGAVRSLLKAYRTACHYGDDGGSDSSSKFSVMSSNVFNKVMIVVLSEMDRILRELLKLPTTGGKKEIILDVTNTKQWKNYNHLVKSYLGNSLHVLNQMTDTEMIAFTLRRLRYSSIFLAPFPALLRKYIKAALHFWGTGGGALPVVSFLFLRDLCVRLGSDAVDECFKGIYKAYVLNCHFVNAAKLKHLQFLANCVIELLGVDLPAAYQHAFVFIRQLAMILREAHDVRHKDSKTKKKELLHRKVYEWKFMNCLELWTGAICAYSSEADFKPLAYPMTQILSGVARLAPTARYFPLRLRCVRMLNRIAASTETFIPVSMLLLDMLEMKELNRTPTGGAGKAVDMRTVLKVDKAVVKTRSFQEACVYSVIEELAEHLSQWSYSVAFFELSFIPAARLRNFCKSTKVERFRKETTRLIRQIEANSKYTNARRASISFLPNDPAVSSFLEDEKKKGASPLSQYVNELHERSRQRNETLAESSVVVGEHASVFGGKLPVSEDEDDDGMDEEGAAVFSSDWLPGGDSKSKNQKDESNGPKESKKKKKKKKQEEAQDEDIVEDLVISSDEDQDSEDDEPVHKDTEDGPSAKRQNKKRKAISRSFKGKSKGRNKKAKKLKRA